MFTDFSDKELLELLAQESDEKHAFNEIYSRYWKKTYEAAIKVYKDPEITQDCVQDVFLSLWRRRKELSAIESLEGYMHTAVKMLVLRTLAANHTHKNKINHFMKGQNTISPSGADSKIRESETNAKFWKSLVALPAQCRDIYYLYTEQLTHKQIANRLNITEKTVNNQFGKIIRKCRMGVHDAESAILLFGIAMVFLEIC